MGLGADAVAEAAGRPVRMPDKLPDRAVVSCPLSAVRCLWMGAGATARR